MSEMPFTEEDQTAGARALFYGVWFGVVGFWLPVICIAYLLWWWLG